MIPAATARPAVPVVRLLMAASAPPSTTTAIHETKEQHQLVLPTGVLPMAALVPSTAAVARDYGCTGASSSVGVLDRLTAVRPAAAAPATVGSATGYASVVPELCLGPVHSTSARFAVVTSLPWQQLLIPVGPGGKTAGGSRSNSGNATSDDLRCVVTVPLCSLAPPPSQQQQQQQQQQQSSLSAASSDGYGGTAPTAAVVATAAPTLQLLSMPTGQLFLAPVGGYGSIAGFQTLAFAQPGASTAGMLQPAQAIPVVLSSGTLPATSQCPSVACPTQLQSHAGDKRPPTGAIDDQSTYSYSPSGTYGAASSDLGIIDIAGDAGFTAQLFSSFIQAAPSTAVSPATASATASLVTVSSAGSRQSQQRGHGRPALCVEFAGQGGDDYRPLPSIQTLAQHCTASTSVSSTTAAAAALCAAATAGPTHRTVDTLRLPLITSSATLGGSRSGSSAVAARYQPYTAAAAAPAAILATEPDFLRSSLGQLQEQRVDGSSRVSTSRSASAADGASLQGSDCQPSSTVTTASGICDDGAAGASVSSNSNSSSGGCCLSASADGNDVTAIDEIREFARQFKLRRLSLGLTQTQVGQALSNTAADGPAYSQSAICRFEKLDITPKSAHKIKPVLEQWLREAEDRQQVGEASSTSASAVSVADGCDTAGAQAIGAACSDVLAAAATAMVSESQQEQQTVVMAPARKRKRRTSFTPFAVDALNEYFRRNTHPSGAEMTELASHLKYDREVVRVWFCNKRQALKNSSNRLRLSNPRSPGGLTSAAADAATSPSAATSAVSVTVGDDLSTCAVGSSTLFS